MSNQTTLFCFSSAKCPRLDADESTETSQTTQNINDETEDEDGHPSSLLKLAAVALTLPIHTSDCERGFSLQNFLKTSERNRLLPQRVDTLMLISAEGPPIESFNFEPAVRRWQTSKERRIFAKSH